MAGPFGTPQQPITLAEIEQQIATYQEALDEADRRVGMLRNDLCQAQSIHEKLKRTIEVWQGFAKTLKELR